MLLIGQACLKTFIEQVIIGSTTCLKQNWSQLDTAGVCQSIVVTQPSFIDNTFSIQNTCTTKHIGLDLSDVIKHIDAPDWAGKSTK